MSDKHVCRLTWSLEAWLIKNPKTLLLPGDVVDGKPGNGSLHWRIPRELGDTKRDGHLAGGGGAPSPQDGQIAFNIAFDVNNSLLLITLGLLVALYLTATICLMIKRWWGGRVSDGSEEEPYRALRGS